MYLPAATPGFFDEAAEKSPNSSKCHRLARWIVAFSANLPKQPQNIKCHGLVPWMVTLVAGTTACEQEA